ncbi:MAG: hypothetical protein V8R80_09890 [Eubacterium sp.]
MTAAGKEVHDFMRPFRKGAGSYDLVVPKFQKFADSRGQEKYYARGTFTRHNLDFSKDVLHLADLGFEQISVEPVVAENTRVARFSGGRCAEICVPNTMQLLAKVVEKKEIREEDFNFFHFMIDLEGGLCGQETVRMRFRNGIWPVNR